MDMETERHFLLHMMKFIFQVTGRRLPDDLLKQLDEFPIDQYSYFTVKITKAILILIIDEVMELPVDIGSEDFEARVMQLRLMYGHREFLEFCALYGMKAVQEYSEKKFDSPSILYESIVKMLSGMKKTDHFNIDSWEELDKAALEIILEDKERCRSLSNKDLLMSSDMPEEREFVLRVMKYVFTLYFYDVPGCIEVELDDLAEEDKVFTPEFTEALAIVLNDQALLADTVDVECIENYLYKLVFKYFNHRDFIEFCVCYSSKAVREYYEDLNARAPLKAYECIVRILKYAKQKDLFFSCDDIEDMATQIIADDLEKQENEQKYLNAPTNVKYVFDKFVPLRRASDSESLIVSSNNEQAHFNITTSSKNLDEYAPLRTTNDAETLLVSSDSDQNRKEACKCCKCS